MTAPFLAFEPRRGFGVYIHWPYCARICPYCDFNVYAAKTRDPEPMLAAITRDLAGWRNRSGARVVDSVFLGGGTPSLLTGVQVGRLLEQVDELWGLAPDAEITLEANPDDIERFGDLVHAGVNRLSLGVQALRDDALAFLGRTHSARQALGAVDAALAAGPSVSVDLIYSRPGQAVDAWLTELDEALALGAHHYSLYQLTIESKTPFGRQVQRGAWTPLAEDPSADLYEATQKQCETAGLRAYEISNLARGRSHESRHNRVYWSDGDWVGAGPGAHGRLTAEGRRVAVTAARRPADYIRMVDANGVGWSEQDTLSALDIARERVAMGLRVTEGLAVSDIEALGLGFDGNGLARMQSLGLVQIDAGRLSLTAPGRLVADRVAAEISP